MIYILILAAALLLYILFAAGRSVGYTAGYYDGIHKGREVYGD